MSIKNKVGFTVALATIGFLLIVGGCARKKAIEKGKERTQIVLVHWGTPQEVSILKERINAFEKQDPRIKVRLIHIPGDYFMKLQTMMAGEAEMDVMILWELILPDYAARGALLDLGPYIKNDPEFNIKDFHEVTVGPFQYKGKIYGIPQAFTTLALFYNKDIFDKAGIAYPDASWNWDKFLSVAKKLTQDFDKDGRIDQYGYAPPNYNDSSVWDNFVYQNGGRVMNKEMTECLLDQPQAYEAIQFFADLANKYKVSPKTGEMRERGSSQMFQTGRVAMFGPAYYWFVPQFKEMKGFRWGVAVLPKGKERGTHIGVNGYSIFSKSKHPEGAWKLIKFLTNEETQKRLYLGVPSRKTIKDMDEIQKVFVEELKYAYFLPPVRDLSVVSSVWVDRLAPVFLGKQTAKEACREIKLKIDALLKDK